MESVAHLVLSGSCLGYLPTHYAARWVEQGLLRQLGGAALSYRATLSLVSRPVQPDEALNALLEDLHANHLIAERPAPDSWQTACRLKTG